MIEELDDIVEGLANKLNIYGAHLEPCRPDGLCRNCWTSEMKARIRAAVEVETRLERGGARAE
jgi:hypothetical protein